MIEDANTEKPDFVDADLLDDVLIDNLRLK